MTRQRKNRHAKVIVVLFALGLAGGFGVMAGAVQWLIANPVIAGLAAAIAWLTFAYVSPYRTCRWCRKREWRGGKRWPCRRRCWRCKGTRETRRFLAYRVHKIKDSLGRAWDERGGG